MVSVHVRAELAERGKGGGEIRTGLVPLLLFLKQIYNSFYTFFDMPKATHIAVTLLKWELHLPGGSCMD